MLPPLHGQLFQISNNGCLYASSHNLIEHAMPFGTPLTGTLNNSVGSPRGIDLVTYCTDLPLSYIPFMEGVCSTYLEIAN